MCKTSPGKPARDFADEIIARDPSNVYAYFVAASQRSPEHILEYIVQTASRGFNVAKKREFIDPYMLRKLLLEITENLLSIGRVTLLSMAPDIQEQRERAETALKTALMTAEEYLLYTPIDAIDLPCVLQLAQASWIVLEGSNLSLDIPAELKVRSLASRTIA